METETTPSKKGEETSQNLCNKRNHESMPDDDEQRTPAHPTKLRKEQLITPGIPKSDLERASFYLKKARELKMYFEKFKMTTKKKLNATNNSELDKGVELLNELVTELCLENIHYETPSTNGHKCCPFGHRKIRTKG